MKTVTMLSMLSVGALCFSVQAGAGGVSLPSVECAAAHRVTTFEFTGGAQVFSVPAGVTSSITVVANGAQGGTGALAGC